MFFNRRPENRSDQGQVHSRALDQVPAARQPERSQSLIDASLAIVGDLRSEGDVQVDGHICGNVHCAQLVVGKDGAITGAVTAEQAVVRGRITGTIRASLVILQDTARVESEIVYTVLAIDDGATFEGAARHSPDPLQDADAASSLAELQQMKTKAEAGRAGEGNRHQATSETEDRTASSANGSSGSSPRGGTLSQRSDS